MLTKKGAKVNGSDKVSSHCLEVAAACVVSAFPRSIGFMDSFPYCPFFYVVRSLYVSVTQIALPAANRADVRHYRGQSDRTLKCEVRRTELQEAL